MRTLLQNATLLDAEGNRSSAHILIEGDQIVQVSAEEINVPTAVTHNLSGFTLLPGFINTHVHLIDCYDPFNEDKLKRWLRAGITCLRDEGILSRHTTADAVRWRDTLAPSYLHPRLLVCGKFINDPNGYGGMAPLGVTTTDEARDAVRKQVDDGADHIKVSLDSGYDPYTQSLPLLSEPILAAICDEAHKLGKLVSAHVNAADKLGILVRAGIDEAAHACYDPLPDALIETMVHQGTCMTPTLSIYGEITAKWEAPLLYGAMDNVRRFVAAGGTIGLGNDYIEEKPIWSPVGMPMMEIELLLKAGLSIHQVLAAATSGGARILGLAKHGHIAPGYHADLIAIQGDPCEMPYLLSHVPFVMKDGVASHNEGNI